MSHFSMFLVSDHIDLSSFCDDSSSDEDESSAKDGESESSSTSGESSEEDNEVDDDDENEDDDGEGAEYCEWEDKMMKKKRTVFVFRNPGKLLEVIVDAKPIPGIIVIEDTTVGPVYSFYAVCRTPGRSFGWRKVDFNDDEGVFFFGYFCAPIQVGEVEEQGYPQSVDAIQSIAQMAAVAIPLRYVLGEDHHDGLKYCVITNWWKERQDGGNYSMPTLDLSLYEH